MGCCGEGKGGIEEKKSGMVDLCCSSFLGFGTRFTCQLHDPFGGQRTARPTNRFVGRARHAACSPWRVRAVNAACAPQSNALD